MSERIGEGFARVFRAAMALLLAVTLSLPANGLTALAYADEPTQDAGEGLAVDMGNSAARAVESFSFGVMSDPHYFPAEYQGTRAEAYQNQISGDLRLMGENEALTTAAVDQMIAEGDLPKVLLVTGDLSSEGEEESHRGFAEQMARLQEEGVAVLVIPGNHDLYNSSAVVPKRRAGARQRHGQPLHHRVRVPRDLREHGL